MGKLIGMLAALAPFAGIAIMVAYRRRAPGPVALGIVGAALAGAGSLATLFGERAALFGGGGMHGMIERLEGWGLVRVCLVLAGVILLVVAGALGRAQGRSFRWSLIAAALTAAVAGTATGFVHPDLGEDHPGLEIVVTMALEGVQFALLGLGILLLCIAVVSRRGDDGRAEPLGLARDAGVKAWRAYQDARRRG
ncbi:hypothetical protein [Microbacterium hydrocarbonoxydans]|uniref:hypothetical protein n=1 Tax=Microbacterium hydrocarbonoxydans TaxID=273678 RepID=UPI003D975CC7